MTIVELAYLVLLTGCCVTARLWGKRRWIGGPPPTGEEVANFDPIAAGFLRANHRGALYAALVRLNHTGAIRCVGGGIAIGQREQTEPLGDRTDVAVFRGMVTPARRSPIEDAILATLPATATNATPIAHLSKAMKRHTRQLGAYLKQQRLLVRQHGGLSNSLVVVLPMLALAAIGALVIWLDFKSNPVLPWMLGLTIVPLVHFSVTPLRTNRGEQMLLALGVANWDLRAGRSDTLTPDRAALAMAVFGPEVCDGRHTELSAAIQTYERALEEAARRESYGGGG